jgi:serine/threonine protein kinase
VTHPIDENLLIAVLEGRATEDIEKKVEVAIQEDPSIRLRMEQLSGAIHWPLGSAPAVSSTVSESLHTAILRLEQDWDQVLATHSSDSYSNQKLDGDVNFTDIPSVRIVREIGRGGMGVVFEGFDEALGRRVAIKQLHPQYYRDVQAKERLKREAQAIASLNHPHVLAIYGLQLVGGYPCLIQQFVDGESLQAIIRRDGRVAFPRCGEIALQITQGLAAAHAAGIIHRDLKPDNVLVENGTGIARIGDFGLAKRSGDENVTIEGTVAGTPAFMSPEQTHGTGIDHRSDLFSLGSLLYTMAAGKPPFAGEDPYVVMDAIRSRTPISLDSVSNDIPAWYSHLVDRLLEKDPSRRPQSIEQVVEALHKQSAYGTSKPGSSKKSWVGFAATGVLLTTLLGWFSWTIAQRNQKRDLAPSAVASAPSFSLPAIVNKSDGRSFERLVDAIASAVEGDTIVIARDIDSGRIEINGKSIHFEAAPETYPTIRILAAKNDESGIFLRSDSDLSIQGLRIECQTDADLPWMEDGKLVSGIYTAQGKNLRLEDCHIRRLAGGVCLGVGGNLEMRRTWVVGGDVGIAWYALDSTCHVEDSVISSKSGLGILYPAATSKISKTSEFQFVRSSLITEATIDLLLTRIPNTPVTLRFDRCVLDSKHAVSLRMSPLFVSEMTSSDAMIDSLSRSVQWQDRACVFQANMDYLISRRIRTPNRKVSAGIDSLKTWTERCTVSDATDPLELPGSIERQIDTELPSKPNRPTQNRRSGIHRFSPDLPSSWPQSGLSPGI